RIEPMIRGKFSKSLKNRKTSATGRAMSIDECAESARRRAPARRTRSRMMGSLAAPISAKPAKRASALPLPRRPRASNAPPNAAAATSVSGCDVRIGWMDFESGTPAPAANRVPQRQADGSGHAGEPFESLESSAEVAAAEADPEMIAG